jgi:hypothetical protein
MFIDYLLTNIFKMHKKANDKKYASIGIRAIFIALLIGFVSFSGLTTANQIAIIPSTSAQQPNPATISNSTTLRGDISDSFGSEPEWIVAGNWSMSLANPLSQSQPNPIAKTFDSSFTMSPFVIHGPHSIGDKITISNFKQTSAHMNGRTSATFNGTATINRTTNNGEPSTIQNAPISIDIIHGDELNLYGVLNFPIDGSITKGQ